MSSFDGFLFILFVALLVWLVILTILVGTLQ